MKIEIDMTSESRGKKGKSAAANKRSGMLRMVMPLMSSTTGEKLADAIDSNDVDKLRAVWSHIGTELGAKLKERAKK